MRRDDLDTATGWRARLALGFERRGERTVLARRSHDGPLVVQKALHPEGEGVCHAIVVHPPAGIAGGDDLAIDVQADSGAHALLTTPGAGKWYRSAGDWARSRVRIAAAPGACVEWLPQETILFEGSAADIGWEARLAGDAGLVAWDIVCLGRTGSGERYRRGRARLETRVVRDGRLDWIERARLGPNEPVMEAAAGLAGHSVCGTMLATPARVSDERLAACRAESPAQGEGGVTRLPGLVVARYLGDESEAARDYFAALWRHLRPALAGREAATPRIWKT
ncbi:MAG: urease accessory protein UreD [Burkholderiales bacterium]